MYYFFYEKFEVDYVKNKTFLNFMQIIAKYITSTSARITTLRARASVFLIVRIEALSYFLRRSQFRSVYSPRFPEIYGARYT